MSIVCPTVLAKDEEDYKKQIDKIAGFAERIQIDLKDNDFALGESMPLDKVWWPKNVEADIHVMYRNPQNHLHTLINLHPSMVIVHAESNCDIPKFASDLREQGIKTGVAILQDTTVQEASYIFPHVQHLLIFSGDLGKFGGQADMSLTNKITEAKAIHKYLEIGWDGGINADNAKTLADAGVDVLNVGGAIQNADNPKEAYAKIKSSLS
jgi:ribulose-phosphate 3-epimerase